MLFPLALQSDRHSRDAESESSVCTGRSRLIDNIRPEFSIARTSGLGRVPNSKTPKTPFPDDMRALRRCGPQTITFVAHRPITLHAARERMRRSDDQDCACFVMHAQIGVARCGASAHDLQRCRHGNPLRSLVRPSHNPYNPALRDRNAAPLAPRTDSRITLELGKAAPCRAFRRREIALHGRR